MKNIYYTLLLNLPTENYITSTQLGEIVFVSEKTIRNYLKELAVIIKEYGAEIESKHGYGHRLNIIDQEKFLKFYSDYNQSTQFDNKTIPQNNEERCEFMLIKLVETNDYIPMEYFLDYFCISESTFQLNCLAIKKILNNYNLKLSIKKDQGICIKGNEFYKRILIVNNINSFKHSRNSDNTINKVSGLFLEVLNKFNISMSELSLENMVLHLCAAIARIKSNNLIDIDNIEVLSSRDYSDLSVVVAKEISEKLEEEFHIQFSEYEISAIEVHLFGHRVTEKYGVGNANIVISQEVHNLTLEILQFINITMKVDLRKNLGIIMNLAIHIVSLQVRIKYKINLKNPSLADIKKNYALGYTLALQAKLCIDTYYRCNLSEDEVGYLALIFEVTLRNEKNIKKKNILIVCAMGKTSAELLAYQYRETFGLYLNEIRICNISELENQDFSTIDFVLATAPINISIPVSILQVKMMMSDEDEMNLKEAFTKKESEEHQYIKPELFITGIKSTEKNDVIKELCSRIEEAMPLPDHFAEAVIERENYGSTDFGELIALAHPFGLTTENTFAAVGILEQPVFWGKNKIQIIILMSPNDQEEEDRELFYRKISNFMLSKTLPRKLVANPTYENLMNLLN